jgi:hypothetical protein
MLLEYVAGRRAIVVAVQESLVVLVPPPPKLAGSKDPDVHPRYLPDPIKASFVSAVVPARILMISVDVYVPPVPAAPHPAI